MDKVLLAAIAVSSSRARPKRRGRSELIKTASIAKLAQPAKGFPIMFRTALTLTFLSIALLNTQAATAAVKQKVRILNQTTMDLVIKVFHFEEPHLKWLPGLVPKGKKSEMGKLTPGTRIVVAKESGNGGRIVFLKPIKVEDKGFQLLLMPSGLNSGNPVVHDFSFTENP